VDGEVAVREARMERLGAAATASSGPEAGKRKKRSAMERLRIVEETLVPGSIG
jgi:hypothetical protein